MKAPSDPRTLDSIAEDFSQQMREGANPSIEAYVQKHGDSTGELRSLLKSIEMIESMKQQHVDQSCSATKLGHLDDYAIVREVGRGGMGVVFEAIHQSLGRRVAIKVLSNTLLDQPKHLARFRREARAAARLRHPSIVPVFGVGQSQEQHYYVMDYIRGQSLREWMQSEGISNGRLLPTRMQSADNATGFSVDEAVQVTMSVKNDVTSPVTDVAHSSDSTGRLSDTIPGSRDSAEYFRWVAKIIATVCDALAYAHDQGVLHRDIKPANLLLDQKGSVWIADFGLAKLTEQDMTMTGDVVGTPQYMAPESFENQYDEESETYCVGLTLFEMLAGRPAIDGKSTSDTIRKAIAGVDTAPRKLNKNIPRDLETIVLKSLRLEPQHRYPSAFAMRDDLQRFLEDRPIAARRTGPIERAFRWSRREPALASLTAGIFATLILLALVSSAAYWKTKNALENSKTAKDNAITAAELAEDQRMLAQSNLQIAIRAFDSISQRIAGQGREPDAELLGDLTESVASSVTSADAELLQSLLVFFDELAESNRDDDNLKVQTAAARKRAGDIYLRLGDFAQAESSYQAAWEIYRDLTKQSETAELIVSQAKLLNDRALIAGLRGQTSEAYDLHTMTTDLLLGSADAVASEGGRFEYARANSLFAQIASRSGTDGKPRVAKYRGPFGSGAFKRVVGGRAKMIASRDPRRGMQACDEAVEALTSLTDEFPENRVYQVALARAFRDRAKAAESVLRVPRERVNWLLDQIRKQYMQLANRDLEQSVDMLQQQLDDDPDSYTIKYELAKSLAAGVGPRENRDERQGVRDQLAKARRLCEELVQVYPNAPSYLALYAQVNGLLAKARRKMRIPEAEERFLREQLALQRRVLNHSPGLIQYQMKLAQTVERLVEISEDKGDLDIAAQYLTQAIGLLRGLPSSRAMQGKLVDMNRKLMELRGAAVANPSA